MIEAGWTFVTAIAAVVQPYVEPVSQWVTLGSAILSLRVFFKLKQVEARYLRLEKLPVYAKALSKRAQDLAEAVRLKRGWQMHEAVQLVHLELTSIAKLLPKKDAESFTELANSLTNVHLLEGFELVAMCEKLYVAALKERARLNKIIGEAPWRQE